MFNRHSQFLRRKIRGFDIEVNTLHWYKLWFIDTNLRSILLYVYYLFLIKVLYLYSSFIIKNYRLIDIYNSQICCHVS